MENQNIPEGYSICPVTGYLEPLSGQGINPRHKTGFLKLFKKSGNKTTSIEFYGHKFSELEWHLQNDEAFKKDYKEALFSMKHGLEGLMFEHANKAQGYRDRQIWLETHFPEDYGKKAVPKGQKQKSRLDALLDDLT